MSAHADDIVALIADIFERRGAEAYLGEAVTMAEHMLQTATLAHHAGAPDALVTAALLHDIGHFTSEFGAYRDDDTVDRRHDDAGAKVLAGHFPPRVVETVRLHVTAKRYLCAVEPAYYDALSGASKHSLKLQGGAMNAEEVAAFEQLREHADAVLVRRWDDAGKVPDMRTMTFEEFRPLLERTASCPPSG
ncbi:HD domain-containing protein [Novosphingobium sp.]|uniref:HD domain-containing protein n=1 Tax=Novosphingobium sp. TaxID=1874826 RepID=UPI003D0ABA66